MIMRWNVVNSKQCIHSQLLLHRLPPLNINKFLRVSNLPSTHHPDHLILLKPAPSSEQAPKAR